MLRALFDLMEPKPDEMGVKSQCSMGIPLLVPNTAAGKELLRKAFKLQLLQGEKIPPCPSGALRAVYSGRVFPLFRFQPQVPASTVPHDTRLKHAQHFMVTRYYARII